MSALIIGGHRGHQSDIRDNTIRNFQQLLGKGIPYIEIDVQLTGDDQLVIFHDARLEEATGMTGTIRDYTLAELQSGFEIDTAEDCIRWCRENRIGIAFELKTGHMLPEAREILAAKLGTLICQYAFYGSCFVFGKDYAVLSAIREADSRIHIGIIPPPDPEAALELMKALQAGVYLDYLDRMSEALVQQLHSLGYWVDGSVVNTKEQLQKALELGVDLIESDNPEQILAQFSSFTHQPRK